MQFLIEFQSPCKLLRWGSLQQAVCCKPQRRQLRLALYEALEQLPANKQQLCLDNVIPPVFCDVTPGR